MAGDPDRARERQPQARGRRRRPRSPASRAASRRSSAATHRHRARQQGHRPGLELPRLARGRGRPGQRDRQGRQRRLAHRPRQQPVQRRPIRGSCMFNTIAGQGPDAVRPEVRPDLQRSPGAVARPPPGRGLRRRRARSTADNDAINASLQPSQGERGRRAAGPARSHLTHRRRTPWTADGDPRVAGPRSAARTSGWRRARRRLRVPLRAADARSSSSSSSSSRCSWSRGCRPATGRCCRGDRGLNLPNNYTAIAKNTLFWPAVVFTIEYTVIVTSC